MDSTQHSPLIGFAYDGNPNSNPYSPEVNWSAWRNRDNERFIVFDTENDQGIKMNRAILSSDSILQNLSSENLSIKQKCISSIPAIPAKAVSDYRSWGY